MSDEEKEAIEKLKNTYFNHETYYVVETVLNYIDKLQKENEKTYYVAVDIGCIECGEESAVLGIFDTKEQAEKVCEENKKLQYDDWTGQHYFYVDIIKELNKEYSPYKENDIEGE